METQIGWTATIGPDGATHAGYTFNAWSGCAKISAGCAHCYAADLPPKMRRGADWGVEAKRKEASADYWRGAFAWARKAERLGVRLKVFAQSVADWAEERDDLHGPRMRLLALACLTGQHLDWLLLTKRAAHMRAIFDAPDLVEHVAAASGYFVEIGAVKSALTRDEVVEGLARLWLGVSVENQQAADERVRELLAVRAGIGCVRFLSCEPLLGPVELWSSDGTDPNVFEGVATVQDSGRCMMTGESWRTGQPGIDWVIIGGESGDNARPCHPEWVRQLVTQCEEAGVPVFFKQWGEWGPIGHVPDAVVEGVYRSRRRAREHEDQAVIDELHGRDCTVPSLILRTDGDHAQIGEARAFRADLPGWPACQAWKVGKTAAGRLLDGRELNGFPRGRAS